MADPYWPYPFAPPPQAAEPAPQAPVPYYAPAPVQAEQAASPDWVICDHCGDVIEEDDLCFILTQAEVKRSPKSGRLVATEDLMTNITPHFYLHEYCLHEFVLGEYEVGMVCENCGHEV